MWPDRVSNPGPPTYESGALSTALRGLAAAKQSVGSELQIRRGLRIILEYLFYSQRDALRPLITTVSARRF